MPRWASRLTLEIVNVRIERLNDISEEDAQAEGVMRCDWPEGEGWDWCGVSEKGGGQLVYPTAAKAFRNLWESINGPDSWDLNPLVWVIEFKRVKGGAE